MQEHDPLNDNEADRAHAKAVAKIDRQRELEDIRQVMSHAAGRRFVHRLLAKAGIRRNAFHGEKTHDTAFALGEKSFGIFVESEVNESCPKSYIIMLQEHKRG